jgi:hypothetical protein
MYLIWWFEIHIHSVTIHCVIGVATMLNLSNIPGEEISGLGTDELNWVSEESGLRFLNELSSDFLRYLNDEEDTNISSEVLKDLDELERSGIPKSSFKQMESVTSRFTKFLSEKNLSVDLVNIPISILNNYLRYFYSELRTKQGLYYAPASLICFRAGLHRHFLFIRKDVNIISDHRFERSNRMLATMVQRYKTSNQTKDREAYPAIEKVDLQKIMKYFDRSNGEVLQQEVMFHLIYYFGFRGRETMPFLDKSSFSIQKDSNDQEYVSLNHELLSKNAKASLKPSEFSDLKQSRMYAFPEDDSCCPVQAFKFYLSKITSIAGNHLFPKPCKNYSKGLAERNWYTNKQTTGINTISTLMSTLSMKLNLSKKYTNHCIRVSHVTVLKENGFSNSMIASNTGHKNAGSIDRYNRKRRDSDFSSMSNALSLETSKRSVVIKKVGMHGKVRMEEESFTSQNFGHNIEPHITIEFTGSFNNCTFKIDK